MRELLNQRASTLRALQLPEQTTPTAATAATATKATAADGVQTAAVPSRFEGRDLVFGNLNAAVLGIGRFLALADPKKLTRDANEEEAVALSLLEAEFHRVPPGEDPSSDVGVQRAIAKRCFDYCYRGKTGESNERFPNGIMDDPSAGVPSGLGLADFAAKAEARAAGLSMAHVLALRVYTTAAFRSLNDPLRFTPLTPNNEQLAAPHPYPLTIFLIDDAIKLLRVVEGKDAANRMDEAILWRGMSNVRMPDLFYAEGGGAERAPMSTTSDLKVAIQYSSWELGAAPIVFRLITSNFTKRGADLSWLSAFPSEKEVLFPPLTRLIPVGGQRSKAEHLVQSDDAGLRYTVIEVTPDF